MMSVPARILCSNAEAIFLMMERRHDESLRVIQDSLSELRLIMIDNTSAEESAQGAVGIDDSLISNTMFTTSSFVIPFDSQALVATNTHGGVFSLFDRAITVHGPTVTTAAQYKLSAILLYNAGLCCHIKGIESGLSQHLERALGFYRFALSLLIDTDGIQGVNDSDALLILALTNNIGHLSSNSFDLKASEMCLGMMQRILSSLNTKHSSNLSQEDHLFFYLTSFLTPPAPLERLLSLSPAA